MTSLPTLCGRNPSCFSEFQGTRLKGKARIETMGSSVWNYRSERYGFRNDVEYESGNSVAIFACSRT
jgi:hypothetical protein